MAAACLTTAAALGLTAFFFAAKHRVGLVRLAPFAEDPYDAVGSFGFQLALVAALISLLRGARRYDRAGIPAPQAVLVLRGSITALLAVFVTMQADAVALLRHPRVWAHSPIGFTLTLGLVIVALASLWGAGLLGMALRRVAPESRIAWVRGATIVAANAALLAVYPETWRRGLVGAIGTVFAGMAVLFFEVWALAEAIAPLTELQREDLLDDLGAVFRRGTAAPSRVTRWLRAGPWRVAAIGAAVGGVGLAASQAIGEGLPGGAGRAVLVLGVFTGLEAAAILFGYALFRRPLSLILDRP
ncbi:MAG: hypothetical protein ABR998_15450 [Gemmatimonadales bacterium]